MTLWNWEHPHVGIYSSQHLCFLQPPLQQDQGQHLCPASLPLCLCAPLPCSPCPGAPAAPLPSSPPASPGGWMGGFPQFMDEDMKTLCFPHPSPSPGPRAAGSVPDCYNHFPALNYPGLPSYSSATNYCKREGWMLALAPFLWCWGEPCGLSHPPPTPASIPTHTGQRFPAMSRFPGKHVWLRLSTSLQPSEKSKSGTENP